jgi:acetylornithine deacetylase/succinyl-diaminopimelate desuccinylase-like protein
MTSASARAHDEVVSIASDLIRIDTTNFGDDSGPGERAAAEYVAASLAEVGIASEVVESQPGRANVLATWGASESSKPPLLLHGHLDVVPANAADWQVDPFSGEVQDGCVWGRGAVDMKDFDATLLAVVRQRARENRLPDRPIVLAFTADEEAGSTHGAHWLVEHRRELFESCSEGIGEVGGFSITVEGRRIYLLQTAEKGLAWMRLRAKGRAGHGSMLNDDNAVTELAGAVSRIGAHEWPLQLTPSARGFLGGLSDALDLDLDPDADDLQPVLSKLGAISRMVAASLRNTTNPTRLQAGYKENVIPGEATAVVDGRYVPGGRDEFFATIDSLLGDKVERELIHGDDAVSTTFDGDLVNAMVASLQKEDPEAPVIPFLMSGGTDGKAWGQLGVRCFGFAPLRLPADLDFSAMFHGIDERVPVDSLQFGTRVLDGLLDRI